MIDPGDEVVFRRARRVLWGHYEKLTQSVSNYILEHEDSLASSYLGHGDEIADRYGPQIMFTGVVISALDQMLAIAAGTGPPPVRVEAIEAPREEIHERLEEWFDDNPEAQPLSVQVLEGETPRAIVVYRDGESC